MGVDTRRPLLPAPTDSSFHDTTGGSATGTDLATDLSRRTDRTSYSIPDDGSPITISTRRRSQHRERDDKVSRESHTSLLIEYFEGGKKSSGGLTSRPSVRVRVTPSSARKNKDQEGQIHISETTPGRKPSYTRRISLGTPSRTKEITDGGTADDLSLSSLASGPDETGRRPPVEIEFMNRDSEVSRYLPPTSDISSMPPESFLGTMGTHSSRRRRSASLSDDEGREMSRDENLLKTPSRRRSRSLSRERIAQKAAEKISGQPREISRSKRRYEDRSQSRDLNSDIFTSDPKSSRRHSGKHREKDYASAESSLLSHSALSGQKGGDQYSFRSGTSRSSLNNPKLLETVEDAIRRLILPELKELKKDQKVQSNRSKFDREAGTSHAPASNSSKGELGRSLSKHASAPDVRRPKVIVTDDDPDDAPFSPSVENLTKSRDRRREKHRIARNEKSSPRKKSGNLEVDDSGLYRKRSKGLRDAEAAKIVGSALTAAALHHHDSKSSLGGEGGRRGSKGDSINLNETEVVFDKHDVPAMPFRSDIDSSLTRDSILSQQTDNTAAPLQEVVRGSPRGFGSPVPREETLTPRASGRNLRNSRSNLTSSPAQVQGDLEGDTYQEYASPPPHSKSPAIQARLSPYEENSHGEFLQRRALSPIQSVASYQEEELPHERGIPRDTLSPAQVVAQRLSIASLSSAASTDLARSTRNTDQSSEKRRPTIDQHDESGVEFGYEDSPRTSKSERAEESLGEESDAYDDHRRSLAQESDPKADMNRMSTYSNDSFDDRSEPGQEVAKGLGSNPRLVHIPDGVESAVASLLDPSVVDSNNSPNDSLGEQGNRPRSWSPRVMTREATEPRNGSPLKQQHNASGAAETSFQKRMGVTSPPQSLAYSSEEEEEEQEQPRMGASGLPTAGSPLPEIGHYIPDEESEINTNPSIIQGPIGGIPHEDREHWPYEPTPPRSKGDMLGASDHFDDTHGGDRSLDGPGVGLGVISEEQPHLDQSYFPSVHKDGPSADLYSDDRLDVTSPGKDEGYMSGANHRSGSSVTPEPNGKGLAALDDLPPFGTPLDGDDPFAANTHNRHLSGYSHGIPSPLYDSATGRGIDRIQSKDIAALMDHLTVRDAQRNARDTEILVTLVRSAAEMRNSFEHMKKFIAQQDEMLMESSDKQHGQTQRVLGGPRPLPTSTPRTPRRDSAEDEDLPTKRRNVFKRALKGLSLKSNNDLTHIEDMLVTLLSEMEALRAGQEGFVPRTDTIPEGRNSNDMGPSPQNGYSTRDQSGTPGTMNQTGRTPQSPQVAGDTYLAPQRESERRISPVMEEAHEDLEPLTSHEQDLLDHQMAADAHLIGRHKRGGSAPLATPERAPMASGALSNDTTPRMSTDKSRKHKSSSSSFFPKISRWSKTTASSMGENLRNTMQSGRRERHSSELSRSASDLDMGAYATNEYYDHRGDDRLRSNASLDRENRPPSPLVPSQVSEHPKYRAHRDSLNLQHPQPRPGARYQTHLESQAQNFGPLSSPTSEHWASNHSLPGGHGRPTSSRRSPVSDGGYSATSSMTGKQNAPPRPPKVRDDGPLVPSVKSGSQPSYADRIALRETGNGSNLDMRSGSPRASPSRSGPQRKPTGPRPITSSGKYNGNQNVKRNRYRGSPNQIDEDADDHH